MFYKISSTLSIFDVFFFILVLLLLILQLPKKSKATHIQLGSNHPK